MERKNSTKEKMAQILSCRICLERLVSPKTLTCDHTYCQTCLEDLFVAGENKLICPVCRKDQCNVTKVEAIKDLRTNLYVKQSLEVLYGEGVITEKRARRVLERQETGEEPSKNKDGIDQTEVDLPDSKEYNKQHKSKEDSKAARKSDGTADIVKEIQNLSVAEDDVGMGRNLFSVTSEKDEISCSDVESDTDDAFYFNSENETTVSLKKKGKSQRFLKYLNKKLYGSGDYGDFFERPDGPADTNVTSFSTRDKSKNPASEKNPKVKVDQKSYQLAVAGSGVGVLVKRKSYNFRKYKGMQGLGYLKKYGNNKSTNSAGSRTPSRKKGEDSQNKVLKKNVFGSRSKVSKRHCLGRGRGVLIYLK